MSTNEGSQQNQHEDDEYELLRAAGLWFVLVGIVGFLLIVVTRRWQAFETGEMSIYLLGLALAVSGEVAIELIEFGRSSTDPSQNAWKAFREGSRAQLRGPNATGRKVLATVLPAVVLAAGTLTGLAPSPELLGLSATVTQVFSFFVGILALAAIRFAVRRQPAD